MTLINYVPISLSILASFEGPRSLVLADNSYTIPKLPYAIITNQPNGVNILRPTRQVYLF